MTDSSRNRRRSWPPIVLLLLAFLAGAFAERNGWLPRPRSHQPATLGNTFDPFWETWNLIQEHYVDRNSIQPHHMTEGAIEGLLASLGDIGHTRYLTAEELKQLKGDLQGHMEGIGASMSMRQQQPTIVYTLPNSPARTAGLIAGDTLIEVNGKSVSGLSLQQIVNEVRGPAGTEVKLRVLRPGKEKPLDFTILRAKVEVPEVTWHQLPDVPIAHLDIREFGVQTDEQLKTAIAEIKKQGIRGLIVDLRGNIGGLKEQAVAVTSEFLKEGDDVFVEQDARGKQTHIPVRSGGVVKDIPICVLIDGGTASSAEIFAGAVQDYGRGKLVGTRTFGTGTVLQSFKLSDGSAVLLAVAQWLTPKGRHIWHQGIQPDVRVDLPSGAMILQPASEDDLTAKKLQKSGDKQLLKALELLKEQIKSQGF